jgi:hypothetical protein
LARFRLTGNTSGQPSELLWQVSWQAIGGDSDGWDRGLSAVRPGMKGRFPRSRRIVRIQPANGAAWYAIGIHGSGCLFKQLA